MSSNFNPWIQRQRSSVTLGFLDASIILLLNSQYSSLRGMLQGWNCVYVMSFEERKQFGALRPNGGVEPENGAVSDGLMSFATLLGHN